MIAPVQVRVELLAPDGGPAAEAEDGARNVGEVRVVLNLMDLLGLNSYLQLVEVRCPELRHAVCLVLTA